MKLKTAGSIIFFVLLVSFCISYGQQKSEWKGKIELEGSIKVINNPQTPLSTNAGRKIRLKEILRIKDNSKDIIFRSPYNLVVDSDENVYFLDSPQLFKYDKHGDFVFRIIGSGEGPGEANPGVRKSFTIAEGVIVVRAISPLKVMIFGLDGSLQNEIKFESSRMFKFVGGFEDRIFTIMPSVNWELKGKSGYVDYLESLYEFTPDFLDHRILHTFPVKYYFDRSAWFPQAFLEFAAKDIQNLFVVHTSEYRINRYDLKSNKGRAVITRKFERVRRPKRKKKPGFRYGPDKEFYQDVQKLLVHKDNLWAITSELNEDNDWLVDVFDMDGKYIDNFYLEFPANIAPKRYQSIKIISWQDFLFSVDQDEEGYFSVAKYIIDG